VISGKDYHQISPSPPQGARWRGSGCCTARLVPGPI
jgi:hypothetical protein